MELIPSLYCERHNNISCTEGYINIFIKSVKHFSNNKEISFKILQTRESFSFFSLSFLPPQFISVHFFSSSSFLLLFLLQQHTHTKNSSRKLSSSFLFHPLMLLNKHYKNYFLTTYNIKCVRKIAFYFLATFYPIYAINIVSFNCPLVKIK